MKESQQQQSYVIRTLKTSRQSEKEDMQKAVILPVLYKEQGI